MFWRLTETTWHIAMWVVLLLNLALLVLNAWDMRRVEETRRSYEAMKGLIGATVRCL